MDPLDDESAAEARASIPSRDPRVFLQLIGLPPLADDDDLEE